MRKTIILAVTAAALAGTGLAGSTYAQSPIAAPDAGGKKAAPARETREGPTANQITAYDDVRTARLKAELRLTPEQESAWGGLEDTLRDISKRRADRVVARWKEEENRDQQAKPKTPIDHMRRQAEVMTQQAADLKSIADASEPLYEKLGESQKRRLAEQIRNYAMAGGFDADVEQRGRRGRQWHWRW